ncbi:hypothetical protein XENOCAPTIV_000968, partial [Xenoophorus captivus]
GWVPSLVLFILMTHDCVARSTSNHIIKYAADTTIVALIRNYPLCICVVWQLHTLGWKCLQGVEFMFSNQRSNRNVKLN